MPVITLTSDFGMRDPYAAAMKGVLRKHCPSVFIDDLTHDIAPQDILEAALFLEAAVPSYPEGTIHLVVVDPGVGTSRRAIAVGAGGHVFVAPDNGLLSLWLKKYLPDWIYEIDPAVVDAAAISNTFHGRDIFAPAAAWLANGGIPSRLGNELPHIKQLNIPDPIYTDDNQITGTILHIDRFGNCITNIRREEVETKIDSVHAGNHVIAFNNTYSDVPVHVPLALYGSGDRLEIAVNQANASRQLGLTRGTPVIIVNGLLKR
ncbi:MAG: SAM-dependent chlorinase/fluorinase [Candidatus Hydrogenedentes bacterium]|nr:SAM-dependent chlorinase/fluorinase [Candidatus Hydrogenedentota bacterium]